MTSSNGNIIRVTGHCEFPAQRPVTRSFDVFFDLRPNKRFSKQWWGLWFETLSRPLWRHSNDVITYSFPWDVITHPSHNVYRILHKRRLKLRHTHITSHLLHWCNYLPCPNSDVGLFNFCWKNWPQIDREMGQITIKIQHISPLVELRPGHNHKEFVLTIRRRTLPSGSKEIFWTVER